MTSETRVLTLLNKKITTTKRSGKKITVNNIDYIGKYLQLFIYFIVYQIVFGVCGNVTLTCAHKVCTISISEYNGYMEAYNVMIFVFSIHSKKGMRVGLVWWYKNDEIVIPLFGFIAFCFRRDNDIHNKWYTQIYKIQYVYVYYNICIIKANIFNIYIYGILKHNI